MADRHFDSTVRKFPADGSGPFMGILSDQQDSDELVPGLPAVDPDAANQNEQETVFLNPNTGTEIAALPATDPLTVGEIDESYTVDNVYGVSVTSYYVNKDLWQASKSNEFFPVETLKKVKKVEPNTGEEYTEVYEWNTLDRSFCKYEGTGRSRAIYCYPVFEWVYSNREN